MCSTHKRNVNQFKNQLNMLFLSPQLLQIEPDERRLIAKEIRKQRLNKFERGIQLGNDTFYLEHAGRKLVISTKDKRRAMVFRYTDKGS